MDELVSVTAPQKCRTCKVKHSVMVFKSELRMYTNGALIQNAFKSLSADQREIMMTGMCQKAWDAVFPPEKQ